MNRNQQDKMWEDLSEENKNLMIQKATDLSKSIESCPCGQGLEDAQELNTYIKLFGEFNLFPERQKKTWKDIVDIQCSDITEYIGKLGCDISIPNCYLNNKIVKKIISIPKIYKLINEGYGGVVDRDYLKESCAWTIIAKITYEPNFVEKRFKFDIVSTYDNYELLSFKSEKLAKEFLNLNKNLVEDYYMTF